MNALYLFPFLALTCILSAKPKAKFDLEKAGDPSQIESEVIRITGTNENYQLVGYHFLTAPQTEGKPPFHILAAERDYISSYASPYDYEIENPDEIFPTEDPKTRATLTPSLQAIHDSVLYVFNPKGDEIRPFGGSNYINHGYIYDFDGDGILDRADYTNYGLKSAKDHTITVFEVESIEAKPRTLLRIVYNWHPDSADESNHWSFKCFDDNNDGIPEIAFGPSPGELPLTSNEIIFRMDKETGTFTAGDLPNNAHVHLMAPEEDLESISAAGGIGYPLIEGNLENASPSNPQPYVFSPLKDLSTQELAAFFNGKPRHDRFFGAEDSFPNCLPDGLLAMNPKEAAVAIAEANRTLSHRALYQLALDDRNEISPPESGWITYDWNSSSCYSFSSMPFAIRFGLPDPVLITYGYNSIGVVGQNPWADQPAHNVRVISLTEKEAFFIAHTVFWLNRIRTRGITGKDGFGFSGGSTADGSGTLKLHPADADPYQVAYGTVWATSSISGRWQEEYGTETFINFTDLLFRKGIPKMLGERWETTTEIEAQNLSTPAEERLTPRVDDSARQRLTDDFRTILEMNSRSPLPAETLSPLVDAAGDEALISLLPDLEKLLHSLPARNDEDEEFDRLEKRFAHDHFGNPLADEPDEHKEAYARFEHLRDIRQFSHNAVLREPLEKTITRLHLASDPGKLVQTIVDESPEKKWALALLRRTQPETWAILVSDDFQKNGIEQKRQILATLAAGHPPTADRFIQNLKPDEKMELILVVSRFHLKHDLESAAADFPLILDLIADRTADPYRRSEAMSILATAPLSPTLISNFRALLVREIENPAKTDERFADTLGTAVDALTKLPNPAQHLQLIANTPEVGKRAFFKGFRALVEITDGNPDREQILIKYFRPQLSESKGFMNSVFTHALAYDLRGLTPEIIAYATASPIVQDGDGANYSGGNFKTPVGQRYHIAREITALWSEKDPATLAKMWIAFVCAHPNEFDDEANPLRQLATSYINALPNPEKRATIEEISNVIPMPSWKSGTQDWLNSLAN
ncbi:MAG: hypothetical protein ACSHX9_03820 [Luteolibacter sp.]